MTSAYLLSQLVNGLILGSMYALIAIGFSMIYGIVQLINFAHGDVFAIGAFVTRTDVSEEDFGEGSYDKGILLTVPLR